MDGLRWKGEGGGVLSNEKAERSEGGGGAVAEREKCGARSGGGGGCDSDRTKEGGPLPSGPEQTNSHTGLVRCFTSSAERLVCSRLSAQQAVAASCGGWG